MDYEISQTPLPEPHLPITRLIGRPTSYRHLGVCGTFALPPVEPGVAGGGPRCYVGREKTEGSHDPPTRSAVCRAQYGHGLRSRRPALPGKLGADIEGRF